MYKKKGGKVIGSGGFGCVFDPSLKCLNERRREKNKISKLMLERYAVTEFEEIANIKEKLQDIPHYEDYFLLNDISICKPDKLTKTDLVHFDSNCKALPKNDIKKTNINGSLDKLMILNMPYGGIPIDDYIYENGTFEKLHNLNKRLIDFLRNGIIPMNKRHIYHSDIKDSNVLVKFEDGTMRTRLIDWGLSVNYIPNENDMFPSSWKNRPLQFNVPFSVILFTDDFVEKYTAYLEKGGKLETDELRPFVADYLNFWIDKRGLGHYRFINEIMFMLFDNQITSAKGEQKEKIIESEITLVYITNYLIEVLKNFTRFRSDGTLNMREYLNEVFIKILDKWGFVCLYFSVIELLHNNYSTLNKNLLDMFDLLKDIFIKYLYSPRIEPIDTNELIRDLKRLDDFIVKETNNSQKQNEKVVARGIRHGSKKRHRKSSITKFSKPKTRKYKNLFVHIHKKNKTRKINLKRGKK